jgi:hypothetical protein
MGDVGRWLLGAGLVMALVGGGLVVAERLGLGRLPGDIVVRGKSGTLYMPLATSLLVSIVLTLLWNLFSRGGR